MLLYYAVPQTIAKFTKESFPHNWQIYFAAFLGPFALTSATCCSQPGPSPPTRMSRSSSSWTGSKLWRPQNLKPQHRLDEGTRLALTGFRQSWPLESSWLSAPIKVPSGTSFSIQGEFQLYLSLMLNCSMLPCQPFEQGVDLRWVLHHFFIS